jgi:hypothetical protein
MAKKVRPSEMVRHEVLIACPAAAQRLPKIVEGAVEPGIGLEHTARLLALLFVIEGVCDHVGLAPATFSTNMIPRDRRQVRWSIGERS